MSTVCFKLWDKLKGMDWEPYIGNLKNKVGIRWEYKGPVRYISIQFLPYSWGSLLGVTSSVLTNLGDVAPEYFCPAGKRIPSRGLRGVKAPGHDESWEKGWEAVRSAGFLKFNHPNEMGRRLTQRLQCSSFLVMACFLLRNYDILPKKELHWSLWVVSIVLSRGFSRS